MNKIPLGIICFFLIFLFPRISIVHAETYIEDSSISLDTIWDKDHSPYILRGPLNITNGSQLVIESGVEVRGDLNAVDPLPAILINKGSLSIRGKSGNGNVLIHDLDGIFVTDSDMDIEYAVINGPGGLVIDRSLVTISTTTISGTWDAMNIKESRVYIRDSQIKGNSRGIRVEPEGEPDLVYLSDQESIGGIGNFFENTSNTRTVVQISNSSIDDNTSYALDNVGTSTIEATGNWWGSDGPVKIGNNKIIGFVEYDPWLNNEPKLVIKSDHICCSSILFIPGLEGSRLYKDLSTGTNTLWEPNRNEDVRKLFLNPDGSSIDQNIYSGEPVKKAFGIVGIYDKFLEFLDSLKEKGVIVEWKSFGYDWRKSISEVVAGETDNLSQNSKTSLITTVEDLASRSPTGKVKIIAHSNGGLIAKYLVKILVETGKENLIDSLVSVAVPYLGTPEALIGLLHGDNQAILGGLIVKQSVMRSLAQNMSSMYSLLPSREFFSKISSPTIIFASTTIDGLNNNSYFAEINSAEKQDSFIVDSENARLEPVSTDTDSPLKGNKNLLLAANAIHEILDPFIWPSTIARWTIIGWNTLTAQGLEYSEDKSCKLRLSGLKCVNTIAHSIIKTIMGDGTVVTPSAIDQSNSVVSLDLENVSKSNGDEISHYNILEASSTQAVIADIVTKSPEDKEKFSLPSGASWGEPDYDLEPDFLVVSTHSPVDLHVYDEKGNHTGLISVPPELADNDFITGAYEKKIQGSSFEVSGDGIDSDTYIQIPFIQGKKYKIEIDGKDFGTFTFRIEKFRGRKSLSKEDYSLLPVTPLMVASTTVGDVQAQPLQIDFDGDGSSDLAAIVGMPVDTYAGVVAAKKLINTIFGQDRRGQQLIKRIDRLVEMIKNGKEVKAKNQANKLKWKLGHKKLKNISASDRQQIIGVIEELFDLE